MSKQIKIVHVSDDNCDVSLNGSGYRGILRISGICEGYRGGRPCPG